MTRMLTFQCQHCGTTVEVAADQAGETAVCTNPQCGRPFRVEVPAGRFLGGRDAERRAAGDADEQGGSFPGIGRDEQTLRTVHPAMFRRHPFRFLFYALLVLGGAVGAAVAGSGNQWPLTMVGVAVAVVGLLLLAVWWIQVLNITLTLTTRRTILRRGIVSKDTSEVRHDDVRNLQIQQSFLERLLGVGDVAISSAGQDDLEIHVKGVPRPEQILELVREHQD